MTLRRIVAVVSLSALAVAPAGCGTLTGTEVGAGAGAEVGAGTGYGAGKGALIGAGVGAVGGAIYDITKKNSSRPILGHGRPLMKTFAVTMLSLSLAGLVAAGSVAAQQPAPKQCQPAKAPQRVEGQIVEMSATQEKIKVR